MATSAPVSMLPSSETVGARYRGWVILCGALLALAYLPSLSTRFDFIDDGNLVYPTQPMPLPQRAAVVWDKIVANYEDLGPFRPVLWVHWEIAADALQGSEFGWRLVRLAWCALAAALLVWLFMELGIPPRAALAAAAVGMWNPYRNEIWTSLTLSEGVAMPYALLALVCSRRALRSRAPAVWDLVGILCVLAALGCKNTFAALVPAQVFLRLTPDGVPFRACWRRHGWRAALLTLTLLAPAAHFVYFKLHWHPGQYTPGSPTLEQVRRICSSMIGAMSLAYLGVGLALAVSAQIVARRARNSCAERAGHRSPALAWIVGLTERYRAAVGAGLLLLAGGVFAYLPMEAMSGRYTMPGVWGLDLLLAVLLGGLAVLPRTRWTQSSWAALSLGLLVVLAANVGRQQKFATRAQLLWRTLERVEREARPGTTVAWICDDSIQGGLNVEEGIHFQWHLAARGRGDVRVALYDQYGRPLSRRDSSASEAAPEFAIWGPAQEECMAGWKERQPIVASYWAGQRRFECRLCKRTRDESQSTRVRGLP